MGDVTVAVAPSDTFTSKYCTADQAAADPIATKDKIIVSNDTYALGESQERVINSLRLSINKMRVR